MVYQDHMAIKAKVPPRQFLGGRRIGARGARALPEAVSLSDQVRRYLLTGLTSGRLQPGDRINEAALSRDLGISRNPIREAISGLAQRGFLVAAPRRGHFMRSFTAADIDDIFSFRICVETFALRLAMPKMRLTERREFVAIFEGMLAAAQDGRLAELQQADMTLHRRICELSSNRQALRAHEGIDTEVQMLMASVDLAQESPLQSALIHRPLVLAIEAGDIEAAVLALEQHLRATWADVSTKHEQIAAGANRPKRRRAAPIKQPDR